MRSNKAARLVLVAVCAFVAIVAVRQQRAGHHAPHVTDIAAVVPHRTSPPAVTVVQSRAPAKRFRSRFALAVLALLSALVVGACWLSSRRRVAPSAGRLLGAPQRVRGPPGLQAALS